GAARAAAYTTPPSGPDEEGREGGPVLARHKPHEIALDLARVVLAREPEPLREAADVRVDDGSLPRAAPRRNAVGRLPSRSREPDEVLELRRHLAVELLDEDSHGAAHVPRLLTVRSGRAQVGLELLQRDREVV